MLYETELNNNQKQTQLICRFANATKNSSCAQKQYKNTVVIEFNV